MFDLENAKNGIFRMADTAAVMSQDGGLPDFSRGFICVAPAAVDSGVCIGGTVHGWGVDRAVISVGADVGRMLWRFVKAPAGFAITVYGAFRRAASRCRSIIRRALRLWLKPRAVVMASTLRMRC